MSEQQQKPKSYMEELDEWCQLNVIEPLYAVDQSDEQSWLGAEKLVMSAIRAKVLESYRNGQAAGPRKPKQPQAGRRV
jgi:hypothetical protein